MIKRSRPLHHIAVPCVAPLARRAGGMAVMSRDGPRMAPVHADHAPREGSRHEFVTKSAIIYGEAFGKQRWLV